jgi:hypothetical protein
MVGLLPRRYYLSLINVASGDMVWVIAWWAKNSQVQCYITEISHPNYVVKPVIGNQMERIIHKERIVRKC